MTRCTDDLIVYTTTSSINSYGFCGRSQVGFHGGSMQSRSWVLLIVICLSASFLASGQSIQGTTSQPATVQPAPQKNGGDFSSVTNPDPATVVPKNTIMVKGAWYSASDSTTPVPEGGAVISNVFTDRYFGITYPLPADWTEKYTPPPPSDSGSYVLTLLSRSESYKGEARGSIQFGAHDMFFSLVPADNARQFVNYSKNHLAADYQVELKPSQTTIAGQPFTFFAYWSPVAELHWYVLATEIRCHTLDIVLMNRDPKTLEELVRDLNNRLRLSAGVEVPVCIKNYASGDNVLERLDPVFTEHRFNSVPVRIIIDKAGKVKHVHIISAFPEQQKAVYDALKQWKFKPYERDGKRFEVETGIMFGSALTAPATATHLTTD
ncbi:MAG TPA: energy transducer TonB [Candidatus Angelobacter sp.]|nr:energy transducer TonB [Candidatus Angelobacter sp.]